MISKSNFTIIHKYIYIVFYSCVAHNEEKFIKFSVNFIIFNASCFIHAAEATGTISSLTKISFKFR